MQDKVQHLLFKGFSKKHRTWVTGAYLQHCIALPSPLDGNENIDSCYQHLIIVDQNTDWGLPSQIEMYEVVPQSVAVSTDIYDIHGKRVFSHDIVKVDNQNNLFVVIYHGTEFLLHPYIEDLKYDSDLYTNFEDFSTFEVVGNTFDKGIELVKQGKNLKEL